MNRKLPGLFKRVPLKIWGSFLGLFIIISSIATYDYIQIKSIEKKLVSLEEYRIPMVRNANELSTNFLHMSAGIRGYIGTGRVKFLNEAFLAREIAYGNLSYLAENTLNKAEIMPLINACEAFFPHLDRMLDLNVY